MPILFRDFETRSTLNLADVGAWRYAADPSTEMLCVAFAVDEGEVQIWTPGQPIPEEFITAARDPDWLIVAHNDAFETAIETRLLHPRYGWPLVPIERHRCTMAAALANALPGRLEGAAAALKLPIQKDADGHRLMMQMAKPRRPRKGEDPDIVYWHDDMERRLRLQEYCRRDVEVERELFKRLPPLSPDELALWQLDATVNMRGFHVDRALAEAARQIVETEQQNINTKIAELTGGAVTTIDQVARIKDFVNGNGHNVTTLNKRGVAAVLSKAPDGATKAVLELRRDGGKASARKLDTLLASIDADDRVRSCFKFHGASTGRWSGQRFQPQNLAKEPKDNTAAVIEAILDDDIERLSALGAPLQLIGSISRALITAAPGHDLIGADFSAIESRVLAWLSGETWKLDTYRRFDETGDPALEPYCVTASRILRRAVTPEDEAGRQIGKTCDLAFGFGGGLGAWRRFDTSNTYTDAQVESFKTEWRSQHAATVRFWKSLESMLHRAIRTRQRITGKNIAAEVIDGTLYLTLPSGRRLAYPQAHLEPGEFDQPQIVFKDNAKGGFNDQRGWFGTFTENVVQAVARDLLAAAMVRLEAAGFPIVLHVHDEAVAEVPEGSSAEDFHRLMTELPTWATGLPIAAKAWTGKRYSKQQQQHLRAKSLRNLSH